MHCSQRPPNTTASLTGSPPDPQGKAWVSSTRTTRASEGQSESSSPPRYLLPCDEQNSPPLCVVLIFVASSYVLMAYFPCVSHDPELRGIIILKGNIILSSEKKKGPQKNPVFEMQEPQEELVKPNSDYNGSKMIRKRPKAFTSTPKPQHIYCSHHKHAEKIRWASGTPYPRFREWNNTEEKADCTVNGSAGSRNLERFPVGLTLAVFGIFIIVVFVYITVEKKPLFG